MLTELKKWFAMRETMPFLLFEFGVRNLWWTVCGGRHSSWTHENFSGRIKVISYYDYRNFDPIFYYSQMGFRLILFICNLLKASNWFAYCNDVTSARKLNLVNTWISESIICTSIFAPELVLILYINTELWC
jgi:hypothetical protein